MVDILVKVVDINSPDQLYILHDQSMHQVAVKSLELPNAFEVVSYSPLNLNESFSFHQTPLLL
jgi:hypothetical protein